MKNHKIRDMGMKKREIPQERDEEVYIPSTQSLISVVFVA
jgi:hypothetical protein